MASVLGVTATLAAIVLSLVAFAMNEYDLVL
jgi:hypothetical protein